MISYRFGIVYIEPRRENVFKNLLPNLPEKTLLLEDVERKGIKWSHNTMWRNLFETGEDYLILLEDDAILCKGFLKIFEEYLSSFASMKTQFFQMFNAQKIPEGTAQFYYKKPASSFAYDVANCFSFSALRKFLLYSEKEYDSRGEHSSDSVIRDFLRDSGIPYIVTFPHLVNHDVSYKSTVGHPQVLSNGRERDSHAFKDNL